MRQQFPSVEYCLVRNWIWIDLDVTDEECALLEKGGRKPAVVYAHTVVYDSAGRWNPGDFVRTSPLLDFQDGFLFQTSSTVYVLLGGGLRKRAAVDVVASLFG